ncbi:hypothetical protein AgCh_010051 [Apium graveolens]
MRFLIPLIQIATCLAQETRNPDHRLLASVNNHRRELATSLETVKWQLEDFEREVEVAAATLEMSQRKQISISRHKQFIGAIAEQISQGEANYWWESKKALEGEGIVTWDRFTELFLEKYFPRYMKNKMEIKFLELKQGNMSVTEYEAMFTELAKFIPEQVNTDEKRAKRFQQG